MPDGAISTSTGFRLIPPSVIIDVVAAALEFDPAQVRSSGRSRGLHYARCIAAVLMLDHTLLSKVEIGAAFGRRDKTAGQHLVASAAEAELTDDRFRAALKCARERLAQWNGGGHV